MTGRNYHATGTGKYRYGFNGKETDSETDLQDYGMRIYDSRLAKFLTVDPLTKDYPWNSPYAFAENRVIDGIDLEGLEYMKPPIPQAKTLIVVPTSAGTNGYKWNFMYNNAMKNNSADVVQCYDIASLVGYTSEIDKKYSNVYFADHGTFDQSGQNIGGNQYHIADLTRNASSFEAFGNILTEDGNIILLGCFTAAPQYDGVEYISTFAKLTDANVYGNQGVTRIDRLFTNKGLGGGSMATGAIFYDVAQENAGKWSMAQPDGTLKQDIGNLKVDYQGVPSGRSEVRNSPKVNEERIPGVSVIRDLLKPN